MEASLQWAPLVVADKWLVLANWMGMAGNGDIKVYVEKALVCSHLRKSKREPLVLH